MPLLPPPIPGLTEPSLSRPVGVGCCIGYTASFVGSLYLFRATRVDGQTKDKHGHVLTRDHPDVVKARLAGTSISSAFSVLVVLRLVKNTYFTDQVRRLLTLRMFAKSLIGLWDLLHRCHGRPSGNLRDSFLAFICPTLPGLAAPTLCY